MKYTPKTLETNVKPKNKEENKIENNKKSLVVPYLFSLVLIGIVLVLFKQNKE